MSADVLMTRRRDEMTTRRSDDLTIGSAALFTLFVLVSTDHGSLHHTTPDCSFLLVFVVFLSSAL